MKNKIFVNIAILSILLFGCSLFPDNVGKITIENISNYDVMNIKIKYSDINNDNQEKHINILESGKNITLSVLLQKNSMMTFTTNVDIEYHINDIKFDINNLENRSYDINGIPYSNNTFIGSGNDIKFIINNNGYRIENIRK